MADNRQPCPNCKRPTDAKGRCWKCHERRCELCGSPTASAFIALCIPCAKEYTGSEEPGMLPSLPDGPGEAPQPAKRWVIVVEAEDGDVPMSVRVKQIVKSAKRKHGVRVAYMPCDDLPDGARTDQAEVEGET